MPPTSLLALSCPKCKKLEADFLEARNRLLQSRRAAGTREKQLMDQVAVAIARAKEHQGTHGGERCKKEMAAE